MKQVSADSMTAEFEKQKVIDSMQIEMARVEEAKIETQKEVVVVNHQAAANNYHNHYKKERLELNCKRSCNWSRSRSCYWSNYQ